MPAAPHVRRVAISLAAATTRRTTSPPPPPTAGRAPRRGGRRAPPPGAPRRPAGAAAGRSACAPSRAASRAPPRRASCSSRAGAARCGARRRGRGRRSRPRQVAVAGAQLLEPASPRRRRRRAPRACRRGASRCVRRAAEVLDPLEQVGEAVGAEHDRRDDRADRTLGRTSCGRRRLASPRRPELRQPDPRADEVGPARARGPCWRCSRGRRARRAGSRRRRGRPGWRRSARSPPRSRRAVARRSAARSRARPGPRRVGWGSRRARPGRAARRARRGAGGGERTTSEGTGGDKRTRAAHDPSARGPENLSLQEILQGCRSAASGSVAGHEPLQVPARPLADRGAQDRRPADSPADVKCLPARRRSTTRRRCARCSCSSRTPTGRRS